jgi:hypothetical protein
VPTTVEQIESRYVATDRYSDRVDRMIKKTQQLDRVYNAFMKPMQGGAFSKFASSFSGVGGGIATAVTAGVTALAAFTTATAAAGFAAGKFAVESALEFDTLSRKLEAFTGSAKEANRLMQFTQQLAGPSLFETGDLAKGATLLAAYGLSVEKVLPLVDKLASAMGEGGESVSDVARVFGRLKSGDFGEAFERLRDFGISFDDLRAKGLAFSKSNEFLGTRLQALAAVSSIVEDRFGRISGIMRDSPAAKFASLMDSVKVAGIQAGQVFLTSLVPAVGRFTRLVTFLSEQKVWDKIARGVTDVGNNIGKAFGGTATRGIFLLIAAMEEIPTIVKDISKVFVGFIDILGKGFPALKLLGITGTIGMGALDKAFGTSFGETGGRISGRADALERMFGNSGKSKSDIGSSFLSPLIDAFSMSGDDSGLSGTMKALDSIDRNTAATAGNTRQAIDLRKYALGGGDNGAMGITPIERYGGRGAGGGRQVTVRVDGNVRDKIVAAMAEVAQQVLVDAMRNGMIR